ncbi:MAG: hypothetical protein QMC81_07555 [Thermoanaerobacterales bacterium]|nr:hypothetical protein [Bacillota bacterium]MDI6907324.1 hypothetical protein [Thermoanaerobacterales bacterium]
MALTPLEVLCQALPEMMAIVLCCLALLRRPWTIRPLLMVAIPLTFAVWVFRAIGLPFGVHTILISVFLAALLVLVYRVNLRQGLIAAVLTIMLVAVFEIIGGGIILVSTGWTYQDFEANQLVHILSGLPHVILLLATALLIRTRHEGGWRRCIGLE